MSYAELHAHSNYSFLDGASHVEEMVLAARAHGYAALALTDHDNLCGAMQFAHTAKDMDVRAIIGCEVTLSDDSHLTLLAATDTGYHNLSRLLSYAHTRNPRREPRMDSSWFAEHGDGLICLTGCRNGRLTQLLEAGRHDDALAWLRQIAEWFGPEDVAVELQHNLVQGDTRRVRLLCDAARETGLRAVATGNAHYHVRERHRLQDALVAVRHCKTLDEAHRERRANSEFYMRPVEELAPLFPPEALAESARIAERCAFDLTKDLGYRFPRHPVPEGQTEESHLRALCEEAAMRRYGHVSGRVKERLDEEFRLIRRHSLAGFLLLYREIVLLAKDVAVRLGLSDPATPVEEDPPGRGRGSSVALLVGYLLGLSHIDPLRFSLSLERVLPDDLGNVPDIDLDFPRNIREELIKTVHEKYGWERAALVGMIDTYQMRGAVRDLGKALGLPLEDLDALAKRAESYSAKDVLAEMRAMPEFAEKVRSPAWQHLGALAHELDGFPKYLAQHPGGMVISDRPVTEYAPVQRGAIEGRYVMQWDKDSVDDAGMLKIDFLALGALSQIQDVCRMVRERHGVRLDLSRIDYGDPAVYDDMARADTIGVFQIESAAQRQTIPRVRPRNLEDMALEVGLVRPGVGVSQSMHLYLKRRTSGEPWRYDHPLERRALERTLGAIVFQDQVNRLAVDVAGFTAGEADRMRRAFGKRKPELIEAYRRKFIEGAAAKGVPETAAERIFAKFNGEYMFPESHAYAFGVTAYQTQWLKRYYPAEFYCGLFNQQPMGFYNLETLKEDAKRHGVPLLNPDVNRSEVKATLEDDDLRLGLSFVESVGEVTATRIVEERTARGPYGSLGDFMQRVRPTRDVVEHLVEAGACDCFRDQRRAALWEAGLRLRPATVQLPLMIPVEQDMAELPAETEWERMAGEYRTMGVYPHGHVMRYLRRRLGEGVVPSFLLERFPDGHPVRVAGLVVRRQHPDSAHGVSFFTLEDEYGHIPLIVWNAVYAEHRRVLREPFLVVEGTLSRRDETINVVVTRAETLPALADGVAPRSKDWR